MSNPRSEGPRGRTVEADGTKVRALRVQRGLTQEELASRAHCDAKTIKRVEAGKPVYLQTLRNIARALGVEPCDILSKAVIASVNGDRREEPVECGNKGEADMEAPGTNAASSSNPTELAISYTQTVLDSTTGQVSAKKVEMVLRFDQAQLADPEVMKQIEELVRGVKQLLADGEFPVTEQRPGSVLLTFNMTEAQAQKLLRLAEEGKLRHLGISEVYARDQEPDAHHPRVSVDVRGLWYARPENQPNVNWTLIARTPGMIRLAPGRVLLFLVDKDVTDAEHVKDACGLVDEPEMTGSTCKDAGSAGENWPARGEDLCGCRLVRELGRGGFSRVYLATEAATGNRPVVLKVSKLGSNEARVLGRLHHDHVVPILWARRDPANGWNLVCMPFLGHATLLDVWSRLYPKPDSLPPARSQAILDAIRNGAQPGDPSLDYYPSSCPRLEGKRSFVQGVTWLGWRLALALDFLHAHQLYHRDLKPANVLLTHEGRPLLLDFNLSEQEAEPRGLVGGTIAYMAPEHLDAYLAGRPLTGDQGASADLFALGVLLYEFLSTLR